MKQSLLLALEAVAFVHAKYVWPSKYDSIDNLLYLQSGYISFGTLSDEVQTCAFGANQPGVQKAAQWLRTPFHDFITHNATAKTGGLDASLQFELARPENYALALNETMGDISGAYDIRTSAADLIALAMVLAVSKCSNLAVPLRLGRIDAIHAGPPGVPEPTTSQNDMLRAFQNANFDQEQMIAVTACGHTLGGAHANENPHLVPTGPRDHTNIITFDTTPAEFDNVDVLQYLNDTTRNPLVSCPDNRYNSDKRIYMSDHNVTMEKLADPSYFMSQCKVVLQRMIDTVPGDVVLTEPISPADVKPYIDSYQLVGNETQLTGRIRIRTSPDTGLNASDLTVSLVPEGRNGAVVEDVNTTMATWEGGQSFGYFQEVFSFYEFSQNLSADALKSFDVQIASTVAPTVLNDNGGTGGFPLNPDILFQLDQSCGSYDSASNTGTGQIVAAVRQSLLTTGATPAVTIVRRDDIPSSVLPKLSLQSVPMQSMNVQVGEFEFFTTNITLPGAQIFGTTMDIEVGNSKVEYINTGEFTSNSC